MALEYVLELATKHSPEEVIKALSTLGFGFQNRPDLRAVATGVTVIASTETALGRELINETYNLNPTMYLKFRLDKFHGWEAGLRTTIKTTLGLLQQIGADGILLFNGETPVLMSVSGTVTLNDANDFWERSDLLSLVNSPYQLSRIASL
jgi:hypothetical protein